MKWLILILVLLAIGVIAGLLIARRNRKIVEKVGDIADKVEDKIEDKIEDMKR